MEEVKPCEKCGERAQWALLVGVGVGLVFGFLIGWFTVAERLGAM